MDFLYRSGKSTSRFFLLSMIIIFSIKLWKSQGSQVSLEDAYFTAYNLTADNRLFCILDLRVNNIKYDTLESEVRKGKHHTLAVDAVIPFSQSPLSDNMTIHVEAVGLYVLLEGNIATELREDMAGGSTRVNLFMTGSSGANVINVECWQIMVYFSHSPKGKFERVDCDYSVDVPSPPSNFPTGFDDQPLAS